MHIKRLILFLNSLLYFFLLIGFIDVKAQDEEKEQQVYIPNIAGKWRGIMTHDGDGYAPEWNIVLFLNQTDSLIRGTTQIDAKNRSSIFTLKGKILGNSVTIREGDIVEERGTNKNWTWCMGRSMDLHLVTLNKIVGTWTSPMKNCTSGKITLTRADSIPEVNPNDFIASTTERSIVIKDEYKTKSDTIIIKVWDNNQEDGDIVTLIFNGKKILVDHLLTKDAKIIKVPIDDLENILELYAQDMGRIHPNTAAIYLVDESESKTIILNSDFSKNEAIRIEKRQKSF